MSNNNYSLLQCYIPSTSEIKNAKKYIKSFLNYDLDVQYDDFYKIVIDQKCSGEHGFCHKVTFKHVTQYIPCDILYTIYVIHNKQPPEHFYVAYKKYTLNKKSSCCCF